MAELVFWDAPLSGNAYKVRLLLAQLGRPHKVVRLDLAGAGEVRAPELQTLTPLGRVPFIKDGDFTLAEANAILLYLARGTPLLPDDPRLQALVHQWMFFEQNDLEVSAGSARYHTLLAPDPAEAARWRPRAAAALQVIDNHLAVRTWMVGTSYSVADISVFAYAHLAPEGRVDLTPFPNVKRWLARVRGTPRFLAMEGLL